MKRLICILLLIIISFRVFCQDIKGQASLYELSVSTNRTTVFSDDSKGKFGCGASLHIIARSNKKFNCVLGIEYDMTRWFDANIYHDRWTHDTDVSCILHNLSIPVKFRYNFGNTIKIFVESGLFFDIPLFSTSKGVRRIIYPLGGYEVFEFKSKGINTSFSYGASIGIGIKIPIGKYKIFIKPEYKFGINTPSYETSFISFNSYIRLNLGFTL
jgi:hypothetical protein